MSYTSMFLTRADLRSVLEGLQFAGLQMGLDMHPAVGEAYRAGYQTALAAVAISFGIADLQTPVPQPKITVVVPERLRLGGAR